MKVTTDITPPDLQDEIIGRAIIEEYRERALERMKKDDYMKISAAYTRSIFQDFES